MPAGTPAGAFFLIPIMFFLNTVRVAPGVRSALAVACGLTLSAAEVAWAQDAVTPVVVTAARQPVGVSELLHDVTVIDRQALEQAGGSTLEEVLSRQPGVEMSSNGGPGALSSVFIRGANSSHVLLLIDGMRVGSVSAGAPDWSRLPISQIDHIEIVRGPVSSLYGSDAIGGVIQVFTRDGQGPARWSAEVGVGSRGTAKAQAGVSGASEGWRYALSLGAEHTDGFNAWPLSPALADRDRDGFHAQSASGRLSYALTSDTEVGGNWLYSRGVNRLDGGDELDHRNRTTVSSAGLFVKSRLSSEWTTHVRLSRSLDKAEDLASPAQITHANSRQTHLAWQNDIATRFGTWLVGAERLEESLDASSTYVRTDRAVNSVLGGWRLTQGAHSVQLNARRDDSTQYGGRNTGSAAYGYRITPEWRANVSYGTAFKAPAFNDLYFPLECNPGWGCFGGNPNLKPETSRNREATLHYETGGHHASLTWYLNRVDNLIQWGNTPDNVAHARLEGYTLAYNGQWQGWDVGASWDHVDAKNVETDERLLKRARDHGVVSLGRRAGLWEGRVEVQGSGDRVDFGDKQMAGYTLVNVYGAYQLARDWQVFARVNNLFNRDYMLSYGFGTPGITTFVGLRYSPK